MSTLYFAYSHAPFKRHEAQCRQSIVATISIFFYQGFQFLIKFFCCHVVIFYWLNISFLWMQAGLPACILLVLASLVFQASNQLIPSSPEPGLGLFPWLPEVGSAGAVGSAVLAVRWT